MSDEVEPGRPALWTNRDLRLVLAGGFVNNVILFAPTGLPDVASQVGSATTAQSLCPPELLGRLRGVSSAFAAAASLVGSVAVAALSDHVPVRALFNVQSALMLVCGVGTWLFIVRWSEAPAPS